MFFSAAELACKCGRPECDAAPIKPVFLGKLNMLRQLWGRPLTVNSGQRCAWWNERFGGADASQHLFGNAADLHIGSEAEREELALLAEKVGLGGIGRYATWLHVDDGPRRRWG